MTRAATYLGFALLGLLWLVPLERLTGAAFPVHMLRHMGLVAVVAPLLAFGLGDDRAALPLGAHLIGPREQDKIP